MTHNVCNLGRKIKKMTIIFQCYNLFGLIVYVPTIDAFVTSIAPIIDIPDRPALEQLSRALWSRGAMRGAAVLIGAGVSRGGARLVSNDTPPPPLWSHLADDMARELYGAQSANVPRDPLRLAEEYRVGLGNAALTDFLRRRIRDDAFEPGPIHRNLLDLPWADVLTTNYDTLLERAAKYARRGYDVVLAESDLPHTRGARIIKLHGSLQDGANVVISEEDFRTYPQCHAAFVNTARQVFIENELCLLGFSGDDPNFLQWAGWVRDRLSSRARRIYLVGALNLSSVKRRLLESRGISPIDLASVVGGERPDQRHVAAISLFLTHLNAARPTEPDEWQPMSYGQYPNKRNSGPDDWSREFQDPEKVVHALRTSLVIWQNDRHTCPDWLVHPRDVRLSLRLGADVVTNLPLALDTMAEDERRHALLELAWRHDHGAQPIPPWLAERMDAISTPEVLAEADPELVRSLARGLLGAARGAGDKAALAKRATRFESLSFPNDLPALVAHERCVFARDMLDFQFVAENASKVEGDDPVWGLRRAALLYWVGETEEALRIVGVTVRELRARVMRDPESVALRSRLAWAKIVAKAVRWEDQGALLAELDGLDRLELRDYDPWTQLRGLDAEIDDGLRKRLETRQIEPGFEAGTYSDSGNTIRFRSVTQVTPLCELRHVAERAGLPIRIQHVDFLGTRLADALRLEFEPTVAWHSALLSTKPSYSKGSIDIHLGRIPIARLDENVIAELRKRLEQAISFWRARVRQKAADHRDIDVLRLYVEALSRVVARDDADSAKAHVRLAVELGSDEALKHWWMNEQIGNLLKRSFNAVPHNQREELSSELLRFPLGAERNKDGPSFHWYDPGQDAYRFVRRSGSEAIFDSRVTVFLHHLASGGPLRSEAASRLLTLHERGQLTSSQVSSFAKALWKDVPSDSNALPKNTNLYSFAFLIAPAPPDIDVRARVYAHLFSPNAAAAPAELVAAASGRKPFLRPNEADAVLLFDKVAIWRSKKSSSDPVSDAFVRSSREQSDQMMASVLGIVAAQALAQHDRTIERAKAALTFLDETELPEALSALPVFHGLNESIDSQIEIAFHRPLAAGDRRATPAAVEAIDRWLRLSDAGQASSLPEALRDRALRALERGRIGGGFVALIYLARRLIEAGCCGNTELGRIAELLDELREATGYGQPDGDADVESDRAVSLPLVRAECVRLARALERNGVTTAPVFAWRDLAARDPLPEVRYADRDTQNH